MKHVLALLRRPYIWAWLAAVGAAFGLSFVLPGFWASFARYVGTMAVACNAIPIPAQPLVIFMGKFYPWYWVALVGAAGTTLANLLDYEVFSTAFKFKLLRRIKDHEHSQATIATFKRVGFPALAAANFIVFSWDLVRLVAIAAAYPRWKYALATFLGRSARYAILAVVGTFFQPPWWALIILTGVLGLPALISWLRARGKSKTAAGKNGADASTAARRS